MKLLITGATGFIGRALCKALAREGHDLIVLTRDPSRSHSQIPAPHHSIQWGKGAKNLTSLEAAFLKEIQGVIHLAGKSIASARWTSAVKKELHDSRVEGTKSVIKLLESVGNPGPQVFLSSSAVGYYGDCGDEVLTESHPAGTDFLARLCQDWENALFRNHPLLKNTRKVALRTGVVFGKGGGALQQMEPVFSAGAGGSLGSGRQWMSWIHLEDLIRLYIECLNNKTITGSVNGCAPEPITNQEFTKTFATTIHRPSVLSVPAPALKLALGEMATALLSSQRAIPRKLESVGFKFKFPKASQALEQIYQDSLAAGYDEILGELWISKPVEEVFKFFAAAENLEAITPPWLQFKILKQSTPSIQQGSLIDYRLKIHGIPLRWKTEIQDWSPPSQFVDTQLKGPYQHWHHRHTFEALRGGTLIRDHVHYRLPLGYIGRLVGGAFARNDVNKIFNFRSKKLYELLT